MYEHSLLYEDLAKLHQQDLRREVEGLYHYPRVERRRQAGDEGRLPTFRQLVGSLVPRGRAATRQPQSV